LLQGQHVGDVERILAILVEAGVGAGPRSGVEMALWDLLGKAAGLPVCRLLGGIVREEVEFCACMGLKPPEEAAETARIYARRRDAAGEAGCGRRGGRRSAVPDALLP